MSNPFPIRAGTSSPLGATFDGDGVNFAVFSRHATQVSLCLFDEAGNETQIIKLPEREGHVWHGYLQVCARGSNMGIGCMGPIILKRGTGLTPINC